MTITFSGSAGVATYRAIALKHGLKLYAAHGIKPNRHWTPTAMLRTAGELTGKIYKRGQYREAIADLTAWINVNGTIGD
jgi:hypothetical protein